MNELTRVQAEQIVHSDYDWVANHDLSWLTNQITAALAQAQRETWEQAAAYLDDEAKRFVNIDDGEAYMIRQFAKHCRAQAQEEN